MMYNFTATESDDVKVYKPTAPLTLSEGLEDPKSYNFSDVIHRITKSSK